MHIVILDGYTTNPGDLSWEPVARFGTVTVYDRTAPDEILERSEKADILITNKTVLTEEILNRLPSLKFISLLSTGTNAVDLSAAAKRNIPVANVPGYSTPTVAQTTFSLIHELCFHAAAHSEAVRRGDWTLSKDFCFWKYPLIELAGKTLGIIGYGAIGRSVAAIGRAMGMRIKINSRTRKADIADVEWGTLEEVAAASDILTLHCPLTAENEKFINKQFLARMKQTAFLINTARGGLINEADLAEALNDGRLAGAGLDVLSSEPPDESNPLLQAKNCIITPHIAWASREARTRLIDIVGENIGAYLNGAPQNIVN